MLQAGCVATDIKATDDHHVNPPADHVQVSVAVGRGARHSGAPQPLTAVAVRQPSVPGSSRTSAKLNSCSCWANSSICCSSQPVIRSCSRLRLRSRALAQQRRTAVAVARTTFQARPSAGSRVRRTRPSARLQVGEPWRPHVEPLVRAEEVHQGRRTLRTLVDKSKQRRVGGDVQVGMDIHRCHLDHLAHASDQHRQLGLKLAHSVGPVRHPLKGRASRPYAGVTASEVKTACVSTTRSPMEPRAWSVSDTVMAGNGSTPTYSLMLEPETAAERQSAAANPPGSGRPGRSRSRARIGRSWRRVRRCYGRWTAPQSTPAGRRSRPPAASAGRSSRRRAHPRGPRTRQRPESPGSHRRGGRASRRCGMRSQVPSG